MYLFSKNIQCKVNKIQLSPILSISCHENYLTFDYLWDATDFCFPVSKDLYLTIFHRSVTIVTSVE